MLSVEGEVLVSCSVDDAWALFCRFGDVARLIPTVRQAEVDGDRVSATVATTLGVLPITSRVALEVTERVDRQRLRARGVSYLGETIHDQIDQIRNVAKDSAGVFEMQLDIEPGEREGQVRLRYRAEVDASGKLKRIYQAILKNKVPAMMDEFAANLRNALEQPGAERERAGAPAQPGSREGARQAQPVGRAGRGVVQGRVGAAERAAEAVSGWVGQRLERVPVAGGMLAELWRGAFEMLVLLARRRRTG